MLFQSFYTRKVPFNRLPFLISLSYVLLFLYIRSSLVYFFVHYCCTLFAFNEFQLLIYKREREREMQRAKWLSPAVILFCILTKRT